MVARDDLNASIIVEILNRLARLEAGNDLGYSSITRGSLRVASNEGLKVEGSARVDGWLIVTGTERVTGLLEILGQLTGSGTLTWTGPASFSGAMGITGTVTVQGGGKIIVAGGSSPATLENGALSFGTGGRLEADVANGGIRMIVGSSSQVYAGSGGSALRYGVTNAVIVNSAGTTVGGPFFAPSKSFLIEHPTKPGRMLRHGSTEGPTHGVEYHGVVELDEAGVGRVELPDYFEAIALPEGRTAHLTPIGAGFTPWYEHPIVNGELIVHGEAGASVSWLVKADRELFDVEPSADLWPATDDQPTTTNESETQ